MIVGYPPGSTADILARLVSQSLTERLGQPIVIENRPGAASTIATEAVVRAAPDGHTLLFITSPNLLHDYLYKNLSFNFMRDIAPVAGIGHGPFVMVVNPSVPVHTVAEFIAYAKANPGRLNMASGGNATTTHVAGELFKMMAGVDMLHVPYRGEPPALTDLIAGQVQMMFVNVPPVIPYLRAGRLRALAVTSASRFEMLPGIPALAEFLPGFEAGSLEGIGVPRGTPDTIVKQLNQEINAALSDARVRRSISDVGATPMPGTPDDFEKLMGEESAKWAKVVRMAGIKPE